MGFGDGGEYALAFIESLSTLSNSFEDVPEARVIFLLVRPPHDDVVLRGGTSWEVYNYRSHLCLEHFASKMYPKRQAFKSVSSEWGTKGELVGTFIINFDLPIFRRGIWLKSHF